MFYWCHLFLVFFVNTKLIVLPAFKEAGHLQQTLKVSLVVPWPWASKGFWNWQVQTLWFLETRRSRQRSWQGLSRPQRSLSLSMPEAKGEKYPTEALTLTLSLRHDPQDLPEAPTLTTTTSQLDMSPRGHELVTILHYKWWTSFHSCFPKSSSLIWIFVSKLKMMHMNKLY